MTRRFADSTPAAAAGRDGLPRGQLGRYSPILVPLRRRG